MNLILFVKVSVIYNVIIKQKSLSSQADKLVVKKYMCGILGVFDIKNNQNQLRKQTLEMVKKIRHRGPDWSGIFSHPKAILAHERLAIVDPQSGKQPLVSDDGKLVLSVNGEIYNHHIIRKKFKNKYHFLTQSDCEIILPLYREKGTAFLDELNGIFAFALYDIEKDRYFIARDHMGIIPLYTGRDKEGTFFVSSELKALEGVCNEIEIFPPGHYLYSDTGKLQPWYIRDWMKFDHVKNNPTDINELRTTLENAVHRQLMSDVPYGVLLSGGLDSSIISAIAKKFSSQRVESEDKKEAWYPRIHSFAVGLKGSPDLLAAQEAANHIDSVHHEIHFTIQEGLDAIRDVIYHLETYDVTTVRAATPMYLMARVIKSMGVKMVLSGEGADEIFGGYLYFHKAPDAKTFHEETIRKLNKLHLYDCLRANKALAAWGVEGRVPFLDKAFLDVAMRLNPKDKMITPERMEKWILRKTFENYIPKEIAWRQKEQFSDGVGYNWIDTLRNYAEKSVSDKQIANVKLRFPINPSMNKEEYFYRTIFDEHFPSAAAAITVPSIPSVACSTAEALEWDVSFRNKNEPSGRAIKHVHEKSY